MSNNQSAISLYFLHKSQKMGKKAEEVEEDHIWSFSNAHIYSL